MKYNFLLFFILINLVSFSQIKLSDKAEVSIITVAPGEDLNDTWGHSAIRIHDKKLGFDAVFNYGTYDFNTPNFYTKFMQGKLLYDLGVGQFHSFLRYYSSVNRGITEQVLNLNLEEKQAYFDYLQNNAKPENKKYLYDFFFDNCATKLRFVNTEVLDKKVIYKDSLLENNKTFRDLIYEKLTNHPWGKFGIDLALGAVIDRKATPKEYTFLPSYIFDNFKTAQIQRKNGLQPLVKQTNTLFKQKALPRDTTVLTPLVVFSFLALVVLLITYFDYTKKRKTNWLDFTLLFSTGLLGLLVVLLWFATDHSTTKNNFNVLWAFLPNLFFAFYVFKEKKQSILKKYYLQLLLLLLLLLVIWIFKIQVFNIALLPIILMLGVRYYFGFKYNKY